jgi:hypothetical protein
VKGLQKGKGRDVPRHPDANYQDEYERRDKSNSQDGKVITRLKYSEVAFKR